MTPSTARSSTRVIGFDLARAVAVFGMVVVNFKIAMGASDNGPTWLVDLVGLLEGRAAATFVVLAGVGVALMTRRARLDGDLVRLAAARRRLLRRAGLLFVVGLAYTPIWPADILHFYGVYLAIAALVLAAPTRHLAASALGLMSLFMVLLFTLDYERGWDWETLHYDGFWTFDGMVRHLFFNGFHPVIPWLAFVFVGMILGRMDLADRAVRRRVLAWSVGTAAAAELTSRALVSVLSTGADPADAEVIAAVFGSAPMPPTLLYMIAGCATACAIIAAAVAIGERWP
ncbi:MAG: heparan-alpha-glucosaminide N-acetyltransferase domain-containing protein, partial [Acidobacteriota bacterium]